MTYESEIASFRSFARSFPGDATLLVDTYDTLRGTANAAMVGREMKQAGQHLRAIRLDSGDLLDLSIRARSLLDQAGLQDVQIVASGGLDEFEVDKLVKAGAAIDAFGVGTKVGVSADAPWLDSVYKLVEYEGRPVLKLSSKKETYPGRKQVLRYRDDQGKYARDTIALADEDVIGGETLLAEVMRAGRCLAPAPSLVALRARFQKDLADLPEEQKALESPRHYAVRVSPALEDLTAQVVKQTHEHETGSEPSSI
jgi:nicotinate phosphoribosyltransferase